MSRKDNKDKSEAQIGSLRMEIDGLDAQLLAGNKVL